MMQRLIDELRAAGDDAVLLTGAPGAFSAGLDLKEVASLDATRARQMERTRGGKRRPSATSFSPMRIDASSPMILASQQRVSTQPPAMA